MISKDIISKHCYGLGFEVNVDQIEQQNIPNSYCTVPFKTHLGSAVPFLSVFWVLPM